ncbi:PepSY domain-containing protein [Oceanobacillus rekensis]|uniref:PepSY domain-containing protein n=1 Tax=Oceanobacillus rekensis TaxID=937927 RepID=UPI000B44B69E|nr:PepSY domain-containing protein [Oceanobacillus rekensis]
MNKKLVFALGTLTVAGAFGFGVYQSEAAPADPALSTEEISQLIQDQYKGTITEMEIDKEFNKVVYEVEVQGDGVEYDLKLDGNTGEVLKEKQHEDFDDEDKNVSQINYVGSDAIGVEKAREIALGQFDGTVTDFELYEDDDRWVYEIEIKNGNKEAEFEIDAVSGDILEMEIDTEDDDD